VPAAPRDELAPPHVWMAPAWQEINLACSTEVACSHMSGLLMHGASANLLRSKVPAA
jgi:hypothetical protein